MAIATFNNMTFQVSSQKIYTLGDFSLSCSLETESQDVAGKKPSTYVKGAGLGKVSFNVPLKVAFGMDVRVEYGKWKALVEAGKPYPFTLGGVPLGQNKWLIKSAALDNTVVNDKGIIISGMLALEFEEYVRAGSVSSTQNSVSGIGNSLPLIYEKNVQKRETVVKITVPPTTFNMTLEFNTIANKINSEVRPKNNTVANDSLLAVQTAANAYKGGDKNKAKESLNTAYSFVFLYSRSLGEFIQKVIKEI